MALPLPSSPHWAPTITIAGIAGYSCPGLHPFGTTTVEEYARGTYQPILTVTPTTAALVRLPRSRREFGVRHATDIATGESTEYFDETFTFR